MKVGIISNNQPKWAIVLLAAYSLNMGDWAHILNNLGCASLFCSTVNIHSRARMKALLHVPSICQEEMICLDAHEHESHLFLGAMAHAKQELLLLGGGGGGGTRRTTTATKTV